MAQIAINVATLGAAYALASLGFVLILNATGAVNFAHGDMVVAGGFFAIALTQLLPAENLPGIALLPGVLVATAAFGLLLSAVAYFPIRNRPPVATFVSTIAFGTITANGINAVFGSAPRATPPLLDHQVFTVGGAIISTQSIAIVLTAVGLITALGFLLHRTQAGRALRAAAQDPEIARTIGINVGATIALSFALAGALAGAAGLLLTNQFFLTPQDGGLFMLKVYIAVVIGGWGRLNGAIAGAFLLALFEVMVASWLPQPIVEALLYVTLIAILLIRPQGLFAEPIGRRA